MRFKKGVKEEDIVVPKGAENSVNKWKFLAKRVVDRNGAKRRLSADEIRERFLAFVDYYSESRTVFKTRAKQRRARDGQEAQVERVECATPMTESAFCLWLGHSRDWLCSTISDLQGMECPRAEDVELLDLLEGIRTFLNTQLLEGAILGEYTPNLVGALLRIRNSMDVTSNERAIGAPVINIVADTKSREDYQRERDGE